MLALSRPPSARLQFAVVQFKGPWVPHGSEKSVLRSGHLKS
jgi:hypothetical protein